MTRERARELLPVIQAYANGDVVQCRFHEKDVPTDKWSDADNPTWDSNLSYRVKPPEPKRFWLRVCAVGNHDLIIEDVGQVPMHSCPYCTVIHVQETPATK